MKFLKVKREGLKHKIYFADEDDWGYVRHGIIFQADSDLQVTGLELYSSTSGIALWDCIKNSHIFSQWEDNEAPQGTFGMSKAYTVKFAQGMKSVSADEYFHLVLNDVRKILADNYLQSALDEIIMYKRKLLFDLDRYTGDI